LDVLPITKYGGLPIIRSCFPEYWRKSMLNIFDLLDNLKRVSFNSTPVIVADGNLSYASSRISPLPKEGSRIDEGVLQ
jgi:hypothetical protein